MVKRLLGKIGDFTQSQLDKFDELIGAPGKKTDVATGLPQKWDNPEAVADAIRKASDEGIPGVNISHKKPI